MGAMIQIHKPSQSLLVPIRDDVAALMPHAKRAGDYLVVPHRREETRLLRNLGLASPSPILHHYEWPGFQEPFESQRKTAALLSMNTRAYVLNTMGTGKTRASLFAADYLLGTGDISRVLIVAPLSTLNPTWLNELMLTFPHRTALVLHGSKTKRLQLLGSTADFYIINHDGVTTIREYLADADFDCAIIDELAVYRTRGTMRWRSMRDVVRNIKFVWGLTGAPTPNAPTDAYAQAMLVRPDTAGSFTKFRDLTMHKITQFKWLPKPGANDTVYELLQPSVRYRLEDCIDIPATTYVTRTAGLSKTQKRFYDGVMKGLHVQYGNNEVTAANEAVKLSKLLQIGGGYVYDDNQRVLDMDPKPRLAAVSELVSEVESKVIVFVPYIHTIKAVAAHLRAEGVSVDIVYSAVSKTERDRVFSDFQSNPDGAKVIVAHPRTMSHGLTLTAATMIIWYSPIDSLDTYVQANARIARPGQTNKTTIAHISATPAEEQVYSRLIAKKSVQGALLEMFRGVNDAA